MKNLINKYKHALAFLSLAALGFACENDDHTGYSELTPSNPTVNISIPNPEITLLEQDSVFEFTVTLSEPQIVDVAVYIKMIAGDATEGEDFSIQSTNSRVFIPAYRTSGKAVIKVNADEAAEGTETFTIQIGDERTANATVTPKTVKFNVNNVSDDELPITLSWASDYVDVTGEPVSADDVADMILYITDLDGDVIETVDGASFEEFLFDEDFPDGEYLIKAGIFAAIDQGDLGDPPILDLSLSFSQLGKIDPTTFTFEGVFDAGVICDGNLFTLAQVVKTGTDFEVTEVGELAVADVEVFLGEYDCLEPGYGTYTVNFTAGTSDGEIINDNFWDSAASVKYLLDVCGNVTIPSQTILGSYTVTGTGTYDVDTEVIEVDYVVKNGAGATVDSNTHTFTRP